jgi:hypothetical protein
MSEMNESRNNAPSRDANGRFVPGQSGNPAGKKPGTRNRATVLREALADGEDVAAARIVIDKALAGNAVAARFIIDRLEPRPRGRAISLDLPAGAGAGAVVTAYDTTLRAMASGAITPDEALMVTRVLDGRLRALKAAARERSAGRPAEQKFPSPLALGEAPLRLTRQREPSVPARAGEEMMRLFAPVSCIPPAFCSNPARSRTGRREVSDVAPRRSGTHL